MHCELIVPALLGAPHEQRLPALELLLARGRRTRSAPAGPADWLLEAFGGGAPGDEVWMRADPVHLRADRDRLVLHPGTGFAIAREEAEALCAALNRHVEGLLNFFASRPNSWRAKSTIAEKLETPATLEAAGQDINAALPRGAGAMRWHALLNEAQMVLHGHPVNEAREQRCEPAVNGVWLWGAARLPRAASGPWQSVSADDPVALELARLAQLSHGMLPGSAMNWLDRQPEEGRHLLVLDPRCDRMQRLEEFWFAPLLAALKRARIGMITLHAPESGRSFETTRGDLRRFWRRGRPIHAYR